MYANATQLAALPLVLDRAADGPCRRRGIAGHSFDPTRLDRFNGLLARFGRSAPVHPDQLATAARTLPSGDDGRPAACIAQRLERAASLSRMLSDRGWEAQDGTTPVALAVVEYVRERDDVIPDWVPGAGRLDDAIVVAQAA